MQQGDSYALPFTCADSDNNPITPENCADFKVQVGTLAEKTWKGGTLIPQTENGAYTGVWLYPLSQAETMQLSGGTPVQAQAKYADGTVLGTAVASFDVLSSIIRTDSWPEV